MVSPFVPATSTPSWHDNPAKREGVPIMGTPSGLRPDA
jgi:hypothetical protein